MVDDNPPAKPSAKERARALVSLNCNPLVTGHREGYDAKWGNLCLDCIAATLTAYAAAAVEAAKPGIRTAAIEVRDREWDEKVRIAESAWKKRVQVEIRRRKVDVDKARSSERKRVARFVRDAFDFPTVADEILTKLGVSDG